jgi:hypothetical protein
MLALSDSGKHKTGQDTMSSQTALGASTEHDFTKDNEKADGLFCLIVCGLYTGITKEGEEELLIFSGALNFGTQLTLDAYVISHAA